jgi:membrane fusion protein (multidrug efflux system)
MSFDQAESSDIAAGDGASGHDRGAPGDHDRQSNAPGDPEAGRAAERTAGGDAASADGRSGASGGGDGDRSNKPRSKKPLIILAVVVTAAALAACIVWFVYRNQVSTDDAYTDGNTLIMSPKVSGYVIALLIDDNMHVHEGDLLLRIDPRDYLASQAQAKAQLDLAVAQLKAAQTALNIARVQYPAQFASAKAQRESAAAVLANAQAQYQREHAVDKRATTEESIDSSTSQQLSSVASLKSAEAQVQIAALVPDQIQQAVDTVSEREAQVEQAQAQLAQANLNVGYTEIRSPVDGFITMRSAQYGSYLTAGQSMFIIVPQQAWVTANFKESQIGRMHAGQSVDLAIDAYSGYKLHGHVQSIQYGSGSKFSAFPAENATGNFVKIVQRVPVKIVIDDLDPNRSLPLGLSVTPTVHLQ